MEQWKHMLSSLLSQVQSVRPVQRQRGGGVGIRTRRQEGERRPDAPVGQHHPWSPRTFWYVRIRSTKFQSIQILSEAPAPSLPSISRSRAPPTTLVTPSRQQTKLCLQLVYYPLYSELEEPHCQRSQRSHHPTLGLPRLVRGLPGRLVYLHHSMHTS